MLKRFKSIYLILIVFIFCCVLILGKQYIDKIVFAQIPTDAIAVRVIPNPEHYSVSRWYNKQKFLGSPQSLKIDGYKAIRDGRTVYVNAANIDVDSNSFYTNIYLISYNQNPEQATIDIFGQILEHWHFNTNLTDSGYCVQEDDNLGNICNIDTDCETGEYCNSLKSKVTRDTIRMEDLAEIKIALEKYK